MGARCDLAVDMAGENPGAEGFERERVEGRFGVVKECISVNDEAAQKRTGIACGKYITLTRGGNAATDKDEKTYFIRVLAKAIREVLYSRVKNRPVSVLVIGLGNGFMTADALGKRVAEKIIVTRQFGISDGLNSVSAFAAGVSGITGIDSFEVVSGLISEVKPDAVLCVDALSAFRAERIGRAYQVTDTGIRAGGGAGKPNASKIDESTVGVPVVAVGVPFVVSAEKLFREIYGENKGSEAICVAKEMFLTPRDVDAILAECSDVVAAAINCALQPSLTVEDSFLLMGL